MASIESVPAASITRRSNPRATPIPSGILSCTASSLFGRGSFCFSNDVRMVFAFSSRFRSSLGALGGLSGGLFGPQEGTRRGPWGLLGPASGKFGPDLAPVGPTWLDLNPLGALWGPPQGPREGQLGVNLGQFRPMLGPISRKPPCPGEAP